MHQLDDAFAGLDCQSFARGDGAHKRLCASSGFGVGTVMQRAAMRFGLEDELMGLGISLDLGDRPGIEPARCGAQGGPVRPAPVGPMRTRPRQRKMHQMRFKIFEGATTDQRDAAIEPPGKAPELGAQPFRHLDRIGTRCNRHQRSVEIKKQRHRPFGKQLGERRRRKKRSRSAHGARP